MVVVTLHFHSPGHKHLRYVSSIIYTLCRLLHMWDSRWLFQNYILQSIFIFLPPTHSKTSFASTEAQLIYINILYIMNYYSSLRHITS